MKKTIINYLVLSVFIISTLAITSCGDDSDPAPIAEITAFSLTSPVTAFGIIDATSNSITVNVPFGTDLTNVTADVTITEGATITPDPSAGVDFTSLSVVFTVTNGGTSVDFTVNVIVGPNPLRVVLVGHAAFESLSNETQTAYQHALDNNEGDNDVTQYIMFNELSTTDLSTTEVIWWHYSEFPSAGGTIGIVEGSEDLSLLYPAAALTSDVLSTLRAYGEGGGDIFLSAQAVPYVESIGRIGGEWGPNLFWGPDTEFVENPDNWGISFQEGNFEAGQFPADNDTYFLWDGLNRSDVSFEGVTYDAIFMSGPGNKKDRNNAWLFPPFFDASNPSFNGSIELPYTSPEEGNAIKARFETETGSTVRASFEWDPAAGGIELGTIVEFNPTSTWQGRVMTVGTATFEFFREPDGTTSPNSHAGNVTGLADNIIAAYRQ